MKKLNNKTWLIIGGMICIAVAIVLLIIFSIRPWESPMERAIRKEIGTANFEITNTLVDDNPWYLIEIEIINDNEISDELVILKKNISNYDVILGPEKSFTIDALANADAPDSIINHFYQDQILWVNFDEFDSSYSYSVSTNTKLMIEAFAKSSGIELRRVYFKKDSLTLRTENERSENMVQYADFQFSFSSSESTDIFTVSITFSSSNISGRIYDNNYNAVAKRTYEEIRE